MEWGQVLTIVASNLALFMWARTESNNDRRDLYVLMKGIQDEMKDFHGRLCAIEERRTKILEK